MPDCCVKPSIPLCTLWFSDSSIVMDGKRKRFEPNSMDKLLAHEEAYKIFCHAGWHHFFRRLQGFDLVIATEFA